MRVKDRIQAFTYLLQEKNDYLEERAYFYDYLQAVTKLIKKDEVNEQNHIELLVNSLMKLD